MAKFYKRSYRKRYGKKYRLTRISGKASRMFTDNRGWDMTYGLKANGRAYVKMRGIANIDSDANGKILNAFRLTSPNIFDGSNPVQDWTFLINMYDFYKIKYVKVRWIPSTPNDPSSATNYRPLYVFADANSSALTPSNNNAIGYDNVKIVDLERPWKYFYRLPSYQGTGVAPQTYYPVDNPPDTGAIYLVQQDLSALTASKRYGTAVVTYYILAKNRR